MRNLQLCPEAPQGSNLILTVLTLFSLVFGVIRFIHSYPGIYLKSLK